MCVFMSLVLEPQLSRPRITSESVQEAICSAGHKIEVSHVHGKCLTWCTLSGSFVVIFICSSNRAFNAVILILLFIYLIQWISLPWYFEIFNREVSVFWILSSYLCSFIQKNSSALSLDEIQRENYMKFWFELALHSSYGSCILTPPWVYHWLCALLNTFWVFLISLSVRF